MLIRCSRCKRRKSPKKFHSSKGRPNGKQPQCIPCSKLSHYEWVARNKDKCAVYDRRHNLKFRHGITIEQFDAMLHKQGDKCAICGTRKPKVGWRLDHCHKTKKKRGILCFRCNVALGLFDDKVSTLLVAVEYLKQGGFQE